MVRELALRLPVGRAVMICVDIKYKLLDLHKEAGPSKVKIDFGFP